MKLLEVGQKYSAARRIFNSLLGVSSGDETLHLMFDILHQVKLCLGVKLAKMFSLIVFDGQTHFKINQDCEFLLGVLDFLFGFV